MNDIVGHKIVDVIHLPREKMEGLDWMSSPVCLVLDNGVVLYPGSDEEGNYAGVLFGYYKDGSDFILG